MTSEIPLRRGGVDTAQPQRLKEELNSAAAYVMGGHLVAEFPETAGRPVQIRLGCLTPPPAQIAQIIDGTTIELTKVGIGFVVDQAGSRCLFGRPGRYDKACLRQIL